MNQEIKKLEEGPAELFDELRMMALRMAREIFNLPNSLEHFDGDHDRHHKRLVLQARLTESILADAIKIDDASLRHRERSDTLDLIRERLAAVKLPPRPR